MTSAELSADDGQTLLRVAREAIGAGLEKQEYPLDPSDFSSALQLQRATFVTLHLQGSLKGCRGSIEPHRALVCDVAANATASAFHDPRFVPVSPPEGDQLSVHISVLNPMEAVEAHSREVLLQRLRPDVDGLLLRSEGHSAVFLPSVWDMLPRAETFISQLLAKAGLDPLQWPGHIEAWCFTVTDVE